MRHGGSKLGPSKTASFNPGGGVPVRPTSTDTLEMLYGDTAVPVPLEGIRISALYRVGVGSCGRSCRSFLLAFWGFRCLPF